MFVVVFLLFFRNSQGKVPYDVATEKETRNEFRRFMAKYPEKYDFKKAKVHFPHSFSIKMIFCLLYVLA